MVRHCVWGVKWGASGPKHFLLVVSDELEMNLIRPLGRRQTCDICNLPTRRALDQGSQGSQCSEVCILRNEYCSVSGLSTQASQPTPPTPESSSDEMQPPNSSFSSIMAFLIQPKAVRTLTWPSSAPAQPRIFTTRAKQSKAKQKAISRTSYSNMGRRKKYHTKEERLRARREQNRLSELRTIERQSASPPPPPELTTIQYQPTAPRTQVNVTGPSLGISRKQDVAIHAQPTPPQTQVNVTCPSCGISRNQSVQLPHPQQVPSQDPQSQGQTFDSLRFFNNKLSLKRGWRSWFF